MAVGQTSCVAPAASPVNAGGVALSPVVGCEHTATWAFVRLIAPEVAVAAFTVSSATSPLTAQLPLPRYEPDRFTAVESTVTVPENWATTPPVATGQAICVTPAASPVNAGGVAFSPEVGCEQATTCTSESVIALADAVAAFNVNEADEAATAQLFVPRY